MFAFHKPRPFVLLNDKLLLNDGVAEYDVVIADFQKIEPEIGLPLVVCTSDLNLRMFEVAVEVFQAEPFISKAGDQFAVCPLVAKL